jgi:hypothetical protein
MLSKLWQFKNYETTTWIITNILPVICLNFGWWRIKIVFPRQTKHTALSPCHMTMFSVWQHVTTSSRDTSWTRHTYNASRYEETTPVLLHMTQQLHATLCRSVFKQSDVLPVPCHYILAVMNFIIKNQVICKQIHLYRILVQAISRQYTSYTKCHYPVFKQVYSVLL